MASVSNKDCGNDTMITNDTTPTNSGIIESEINAIPNSQDSIIGNSNIITNTQYATTSYNPLVNFVGPPMPTMGNPNPYFYVAGVQSNFNGGLNNLYPIFPNFFPYYTNSAFQLPQHVDTSASADNMNNSCSATLSGQETIVGGDWTDRQMLQRQPTNDLSALRFHEMSLYNSTISNQKAVSLNVTENENTTPVNHGVDNRQMFLAPMLAASSPHHQQQQHPNTSVGPSTSSKRPQLNDHQNITPHNNNNNNPSMTCINMSDVVSERTIDNGHFIKSQLLNNGLNSLCHVDQNYCANSRFFVIKCIGENNICVSFRYGLWCSTKIGNNKLSAAFRNVKQKNGHVFLFFSVNGSGHFCGICEMMSDVHPLSSNKPNIWNQNQFNSEINVKWLIIKDVPNAMLRHIKLASNENKPITNSRDCTEIDDFELGVEAFNIMCTYGAGSSLLNDFVWYDSKLLDSEHSN